MKWLKICLREAALEWLEKGKEQGMKLGLKQGRILVIQNMVELGVPEDRILLKYSKNEYEEAMAGKDA